MSGGETASDGHTEGQKLARELITWWLAEGDDDGPKYVARETQNLVREPMLMMDTVLSLVQILATVFGDLESWQRFIARDAARRSR